MKYPQYDYWLNSALPPFDSFQSFLGYQIHKVTDMLHEKQAAIQAEYGLLLPQYSILLGLREAAGWNQLKLGVQLGIDKASMVRLLDGLEGLGFAVRTVGKDRRERLVSITAKGEGAVRELEKRMRAAEDSFLATLSEDEQVSFRATISRLLKVHCQADPDKKR